MSSYEYQLRLLEQLNYEKDTGIFRWKKSPANNIPAGSVAGATTSAGYTQITFQGGTCVAHRLVWLMEHGREPVGQIDHVNGIRNDNRIANLREATQSMNQQNSKLRVDNKSGRKGVSWSRAANKWTAGIVVNKKRKHLGVFKDVETAYRAYVAAAAQYHQINSVFNRERI